MTAPAVQYRLQCYPARLGETVQNCTLLIFIVLGEVSNIEQTEASTGGVLWDIRKSTKRDHPNDPTSNARRRTSEQRCGFSKTAGLDGRAVSGNR